MLPQGDYEAGGVVRRARRRGRWSRWWSAPATRRSAIPPLSARRTVAVHRAREDGRTPAAAREAHVQGRRSDPDPRFNRYVTALSGTTDIEAETFGGTQAGTTGHAAGQSNVVYTATGIGRHPGPAGTYDVYVSRGLEYSRREEARDGRSGGSASLELRLKRVIRTPNAISRRLPRPLGTQPRHRRRRCAIASPPSRPRASRSWSRPTTTSTSTTRRSSPRFGATNRLTSIVGNEVTGSVPNPPRSRTRSGTSTPGRHPEREPAARRRHPGRVRRAELALQAPARQRRRGHPVQPRACRRVRAHHDRLLQQHRVQPLRERHRHGMHGRRRLPGRPAPQECTCVGYQPDRPISMAPNDILLDDGVLGPGTTANPDGFTNLDFDVLEIANGGQGRRLPGLAPGAARLALAAEPGHLQAGDRRLRLAPHHGRARGLGALLRARRRRRSPALNVATFNEQVKAGAMMVSGGPFIDFTVRPQGGGEIGIGQLGSAERPERAASRC